MQLILCSLLLSLSFINDVFSHILSHYIQTFVTIICTVWPIDNEFCFTFLYSRQTNMSLKSLIPLKTQGLFILYELSVTDTMFLFFQLRRKMIDQNKDGVATIHGFVMVPDEVCLSKIYFI